MISRQRKIIHDFSTIFHLKKIYQKKIPRNVAAEGHSQIKNPQRKQWARKTSAEDPRKTVFIKKKSRPRMMLAEHARGTCHGRLPRKVTQIKNPRRKQLARKTPAYDFAEDSCGRRPRKIRGRQPRKTIKKNFF